MPNPERLNWIRRRLAMLAALAYLPVLYVISIGPMSTVLRYHGGDAGGVLWQAAYGAPLGKLPRPWRTLINRYLAAADQTYWRLREVGRPVANLDNRLLPELPWLAPYPLSSQIVRCGMRLENPGLPTRAQGKA